MVPPPGEPFQENFVLFDLMRRYEGGIRLYVEADVVHLAAFEVDSHIATNYFIHS